MKIFIVFLLMFSVFGNEDVDKRLKVLVIDSGVGFNQIHKDYMCKNGHKSFVNNSIYDNNGHGTNIISIIKDKINSKKQCILSYKVWYEGSKDNEQMKAMQDALKESLKHNKIKIINISMGGEGSHLKESLLVKDILRKNKKLVVAAGNEKTDLNKVCNYFPACYRENYRYSNFYVVKSQIPSSNYGDIVTDMFSGNNIGKPVRSGTSQATAQKTATLLKNMVYKSRRNK